MKKKIFAYALTLCLAMSLMACGGNDDTTKAPEGDQQTESVNGTVAGDGYAFAVNGKEIQIGMTQDDLTAVLGEADSSFEAPSCAGQGTDYTLTYAGGSVEITTVPNADGVNLVDAIVVKDDLIETPEGIALFMSLDDVVAAYGDGYTTSGSAYIYSKGEMQLQFIVENNEVTSIQYIVAE